MSKEKYDRNYRKRNRPHINEVQRAWLKTKQHPCIDCGKPCHPQATRCRHCAGIVNTLWKKKPTKYCIDCGTEIWRGSLRCHPCYSKAVVREKRFIGSNNAKWKGGRKFIGGYNYIYAPEHPRHNSVNYIAEHIVIWEKAHGKFLPDGWVVHHINGIRDDNRIRNLYAMPKKNHSPGMLLKEIRKRLRDTETELKRIKSQASLSLHQG